MKKWVRGFLGVAAVFVCICLGGCREETDAKTEEDREAAEKIQIGMSFDSFVIERWQRDRDVFVSTASEMGAEVNVQNANGDVEEQISQIEYFIRRKMDVIVIICVDSDRLADVVQKAKNAGIRVIAYDRLIKKGDVDLYISFDNEAVGRMMGEGIMKRNAEVKNVLMLGGPLTDNNVYLVEKGFREVMDRYHVHIVDSIHAEGWRAEVGGEYVYNNMAKINETDAIMCGNDDIATQVVRALAERRLAGRIQVVGQDADLAACQRIVQGTQVMTVYKPVEKLARSAAEYAIRLAKGEKLETEHTIDDGSRQVPYVALEPVSVYQNNMDEVIIGSGFHLKEDVYRNVPHGGEENEEGRTDQEGVLDKIDLP